MNLSRLACFVAGVVVATACSPRGATLGDYYAHVVPGQRAGMLVWQDTLEWTSEWISHPNGDVQWLDPHEPPGSFEQMTVRDGYLVLLGFEHRYSADCTLAEIEDINSAVRYPITCRGGHYYSPMLLPRDPWRMRMWGTIAGGRRFYWQSDFYPGEQAFNACWFEGAQSREVVRQLDSWWSEPEGWVRATGGPPFDAAGRPVRPAVSSTYEITLAKGVGPWTIRDKSVGRDRCAYSMWSWQ